MRTHTAYRPAVGRIRSDCTTYNSWLSANVAEKWGSDPSRSAPPCPLLTGPLASCVLTALSYLTDVHALLRGHEAQHREHHEARKEAGAAVDYSQYESISAEDRKGK